MQWRFLFVWCGDFSHSEQVDDICDELVKQDVDLLKFASCNPPVPACQAGFWIGIKTFVRRRSATLHVHRYEPSRGEFIYFFSGVLFTNQVTT